MSDNVIWVRDEVADCFPPPRMPWRRRLRFERAARRMAKWPETTVTRYHNSDIWFFTAIPQWDFPTAALAAEAARAWGYRPVITERCCALDGHDGHAPKGGA